MRLPRMRFTVRWFLVLVAVAALASLAVAKVCRECQDFYASISMFAESAVAAAFGLGAMHRPSMLLVALSVILASPSIDRSDFGILLVGGCSLGWIIGASVGSLSRSLKRDGKPLPNGLR